MGLQFTLPIGVQIANCPARLPLGVPPRARLPWHAPCNADGVVRRWKGEEMVARPGPDPEAQALREEIRQLKARVATLERIATDSSSSLDREIESLRDRP